MSRLGRALLRSIKHMTKTEYEKRTGKRAWSYDLWEIWHAAQDTLFYSWWTPIIVCYEAIERIIKWIPILWKDRNWDWANILCILEHKIRFTRECIQKYGHHVNSDQDCIEMKQAEFLLKRLQDPHGYVQKDWDEHFSRWPSYMRKCIENKDGSVTIPAPSKEESKDTRRMWDKENYMWRQDMDYLCKHLKKHLQGWWD